MRPLASSLHGLFKLVGVVADHGDPLVWTYSVCVKKLIQPRGRLWYLLMDVRIQARGSISKRRATCDDIDMALLDNFLRPGRFQLR